MLMHVSRAYKRGFTLIEVMIVVAIVGILAAIAITAFTYFIDESRNSEAAENLKVISDGAVAYYNIKHICDGDVFHKSDGLYPGCADDCLQTECKKSIPTEIRTNGQKTAVTAGWDDPSAPWQRLGFKIDKPFYYQYIYDTLNRTAFTASAEANFGNKSIWEIKGNDKGVVTALRRVQ